MDTQNVEQFLGIHIVNSVGPEIPCWQRAPTEHGCFPESICFDVLISEHNIDWDKCCVQQKQQFKPHSYIWNPEVAKNNFHCQHECQNSKQSIAQDLSGAVMTLWSRTCSYIGVSPPETDVKSDKHHHNHIRNQHTVPEHWT